MEKLLSIWQKLVDLSKQIKDITKSYIQDKKKKLSDDIENKVFFEKYYLSIIKSILLIFVLLGYLYINSWEYLIVDFLKIDLNPISDAITENHFFDLSFSILILISITIYILFRINDHRYWSKIKFLAILISLYPFLSDTWSFTYSNIFPWLCYAKSIYFVFLIEMLHSIYRIYIVIKLKEKLLNENVGFIIDNPYDHKNEDLSGINRENYAKQLIEKIQNTDTKTNAFAIGIAGTWGSGKSTFMNTVKKELNNNSIIIEYSPWFSKNKDQVIVDFFDTLNRKLSRYNPALSKQFTTYANALSEIVDSKTFTKITKAISIGSKTLDLKDQYNKVSIEISKINKPICVFIDDLDRLEKSEIMEVLRLIRNTANFRNTVFIVGYDREYIIDSIGSQGIINPEQYLEKIFSVEVSLPIYEKDILLNELKINLSKKLSTKNINGISTFIYRKNISQNEFLISHFLYNIREVKRFSNIFSLNLNSFSPHNEQDINPIELFVVELIRYRFFALYLLLSENPYSILDYNRKDDRFYFRNAIFDDNLKKLVNIDYTVITLFEKIDKFITTKFNSAQKDVLLEILSLLFSNNSNRNKKNSICFNHNYSKYFAFRIMNYNLSSIEFKNSIESYEKLKEQVDKCIQEGRLKAILTMFETADIISLPLESFKILFDGFYYLGIQLCEKNIYIANSILYLRVSETFFKLELIKFDELRKKFINQRIASISEKTEAYLMSHILKRLYYEADIEDDYYSQNYIFDNREIGLHLKEIFKTAISQCQNTSELFNVKNICYHILENCIVRIYYYGEPDYNNLVTVELTNYVKSKTDGAQTLMNRFKVEFVDDYLDENQVRVDNLHIEICKYFNNRQQYKELVLECKDSETEIKQEYFKKFSI